MVVVVVVIFVIAVLLLMRISCNDVGLLLFSLFLFLLQLLRCWRLNICLGFDVVIAAFVVIVIVEYTLNIRLGEGMGLGINGPCSEGGSALLCAQNQLCTNRHCAHNHVCTNLLNTHRHILPLNADNALQV